MNRLRGSALLCAGMILLNLEACTQTHTETGLSKVERIRVVTNILSDAKMSGSIEYSGRCDFGANDFPNVELPTKQPASTTVSLLTNVFRSDHKMQIRQDASGMIRMAEKDVPQDILNVRIKRLGFRTSYAGGDAAYHPWDALQAVLETPEVRSYMQDNRIGSPVQMVPGMRPVPSPSPPHLSGDLENVTVSESLDHILRTFPGLWTYQDCVRTDGKRMVLFGIQ